MKANNVVAFPTDKLINFTVEEIKNQNEKQRLEAVEMVVDSVIPGLLEALNGYGITVSNHEDIGFLCEALKSSICRSFNIEHPLQKVSDNLIRVVD